MTEQYSPQRVPEWTMGDRLRKARSGTGMTVREFAAALGVSHGTVTNAETDARTVRRITLNAWALLTGVPVEWLESGSAPSAPGPQPGLPVTASKALADLTRRKQQRTRRGTTEQYLRPAA